MTKTFEYEYIPGWMGGSHLLNGKECSIKDELPKGAYTIIKGKKYPLRLKSISGEDYDMGHTYAWSAHRLIISVDDGVITAEAHLPKRKIKVYVD